MNTTTDKSNQAWQTETGAGSGYELRENFFESRAVKKIRTIAGGDTYMIIYLKMLILASKNDGWIYSEGIGSMSEEMALELNETKDTISAALAILESCGLVETVGNKLFLRQSRNVSR